LKADITEVGNLFGASAVTVTLQAVLQIQFKIMKHDIHTDIECL